MQTNSYMEMIIQMRTGQGYIPKRVLEVQKRQVGFGCVTTKGRGSHGAVSRRFLFDQSDEA